MPSALESILRTVAVGAAAALLGASCFAGQFTVTKTIDATIDASGWNANTSAPYGRAMNGNSFETSTITSYNGYQYTAYWQNNAGTASVSVARRAIGSSAWQTLTLPSNIINGPNDAHDVISLGLDPADGTIHLAYDMHGHTLRYRVSAQGLASNPTSFTWTTANAATLFPTAERNNLNGPQINGVTYPMFIRTPANDLQFAFRVGSSGDGSWWLYNYSGATHGWSNGHQIDDGTVDTYTGTTTSSSGTRNNYPNNFTYGPDGKLHSTFTWRESATGAANHDLLYVYSDDGGNTWKNNAGTIVGSQAAATKFHLNSPGLVVRPLAETQTLMNQDGQSVDHAGHVHAIVWHRDSAKSVSLNNVWEPQESSYFQYWRDGLGNWHQNKLGGNVGSRPKIFFDAADNAYAIYQVLAGGGALSGGSGSNLYFTNGDLVIAGATKASNWTDWRIIKTETGNFVSEAQADAELFGSIGTLSVVMQNAPTLTGNQGTAIRSLDYSIALAAPNVATFGVANGDWSTPGNWTSGSAPGANTVVTINSNRTANVNQAAGTLDNIVAVGAGGSSGTLNIAAGASLNLLSSGSFGAPYGGSIVVGRDGGAVGAYNQTGGAVTAWRFAVGDYFTETSGGGVSIANVSGGSLTTGELDVGFSANGSSSGSSFNISGGTVTVNGDAIIGEFGNTATLSLSGTGRLTVAGDVREGFNETNVSNLRVNGGTLDMTGNSINVDNFIYNGGALLNVSTAPAGTNVNATSAATMAGMNIGTLLIARDQPATLIIPAGVRLAAGKRLETWSGGSLALGSGAAVSIGTTPTFTADQVNVTAGGTLAGDGVVIAAAVNNLSGTVSPGHSVGALGIVGNFAQSAAGTTQIELGGGAPATGYDQLNITGSAALAGILRVETANGFTPLPGQSFDVLTFASHSGDIALENQTGHAGLVLTPSYTANTLTLLASAALSGDANLDGAVDTLDFNALAANFGASDRNWLQGDFNGDTIVDTLDFNTLAAHFGQSVPVGTDSVIPEPGMFVVLLLIWEVVTLRPPNRSRGSTSGTARYQPVHRSRRGDDWRHHAELAEVEIGLSQPAVRPSRRSLFELIPRLDVATVAPSASQRACLRFNSKGGQQ